MTNANRLTIIIDREGRHHVYRGVRHIITATVAELWRLWWRRTPKS